MKKKKSIIKSYAVFNNVETKRYSLIRNWKNGEEELKKFTAILFNPSIANEIKGDKSSNLCVNSAVDYGCNEIEIVNLYSFMSKKSEGLPLQHKVFEYKNFVYIKKAIEKAQIVLLGWGDNPGSMVTNSLFKNIMNDNSHKLYCYGINQSKEPKHPSKGVAEGSPLIKYNLFNS